jgi:hypothetical protein
MNDLSRIKHHQPDKNTPCYCGQAPVIAHELSQSILVIRAYVTGCSERLKNTTLDYEQIGVVLGKINHHVELIGRKIDFLFGI